MSYRRRHYRKRDTYDDGPLDALGLALLVYVLALIYFYFTDRPRFWRNISYVVAGIALLIVTIWGWHAVRRRAKERKIAYIFDRIRAAGVEDHIKNFIERFGFEKDKNVWRYRNRSFDWNRINDLYDFLGQKGVSISKDDLYALLRIYISESERRLTLESLQGKPQKFSSLTGTEFEQLLYRLFGAMGYAVELKGRPGDQGGDLVANKSGERILIQAKRYGDESVGNKAVQEATAARNYYNCTHAMVITTSSFTREALDLARANNIELISKPQLQELLLQHLKESWD